MITDVPLDKEHMKAVIRSAWDKYDEICASQVESDYYADSDRTYAQGYAEALHTAYYMFFNESYDLDRGKK
jgi:hypothetical protein